MKRLLCLFLSFLVFPAFAVTSESYVDSAVNTLQNEIPAIDSNTVLTNTGVSGEIGAKQIYDSTNDYASQQNALVTAETFNTAVQNAIDAEFVCVESIPEGCLLYKLAVATNVVPNGYTQLDYIESSDEYVSYINTGYIPNENTYLQIDYMPINYARIESGCTPIGGRVGWRNSHFGVFASVNNDVQNHLYMINSTYQISATVLNYKIAATLDAANYYMEMRVDDNVYKWKGSASSIGTHTYSQPLYMFMLNDNGTVGQYPCRMRIYGVIINESNVPVHNFVPVRRNSDGELGMYDTVTHRFFTNSGIGTFIAGPDAQVYLPSGE